MRLSLDQKVRLSLVFAAIKSGEHYETNDARTFVNEAERVIDFLRNCGPEYSLVSTDLSRIVASVENALEFRKSSASRRTESGANVQCRFCGTWNKSTLTKCVECVEVL